MKSSQFPLTLEKNQTATTGTATNRRSTSSVLIRLVSLFVFIAAVLVGASCYMDNLQKKAMQSSRSCIKESRIEQVTPKAEEPAIGHIFWESVTRLIISAKR